MRTPNVIFALIRPVIGLLAGTSDLGLCEQFKYKFRHLALVDFNCLNDVQHADMFMSNVWAHVSIFRYAVDMCA